MAPYYICFWDVICACPLGITPALGMEPNQTMMGWVSLVILVLTVVVSALSGMFAYWRCAFAQEVQEMLDRRVKDANPTTWYPTVWSKVSAASSSN